MDHDHEIDDIGTGAEAMSLQDKEAAMWARASVRDTRFANYELKFSDPVFDESAYSYDISDHTLDNRPRTTNLTDLKRKRTGGGATPAPKRTKDAEATSNGMRGKAVKIPPSDYLVRRGTSQPEMLLPETEFTKELPQQFWKPETPKVNSPEEVTPHLAATRTPVAPSQTTVSVSTELETPPVETSEFLKWARMQIDGYAPGESRRLRGAMSMIKVASARKEGLEAALGLLHIHVKRVTAMARDVKNSHNLVQKGGSCMESVSKGLEQSARQLEKRRDDFIERVKAFEAEVEAEV